MILQTIKNYPQAPRTSITKLARHRSALSQLNKYLQFVYSQVVIRAASDMRGQFRAAEFKNSAHTENKPENLCVWPKEQTNATFSVHTEYLSLFPSDAGSIPAEVVEFFRAEKFGNEVLRKGL
jgi:hypothetical protein